MISFNLTRYGFHRSTEPRRKVEPGAAMIEHFTHPYFVKVNNHYFYGHRYFHLSTSDFRPHFYHHHLPSLSASDLQPHFQHHHHLHVHLTSNSTSTTIIIITTSTATEPSSTTQLIWTHTTPLHHPCCNSPHCTLFSLCYCTSFLHPSILQ